MKSEVEIYWESFRERPQPTVADLMMDRKIPSDSICRVEPDHGVMKSWLEVILPSHQRDSNGIDLKIAQAMDWIRDAKENFGIEYSMIFVNGCRLPVHVLRLEMAFEKSLRVLEAATVDLKATRSLVRNSAIADIRRDLEEAVADLRRRLE